MAATVWVAFDARRFDWSGNGSFFLHHFGSIVRPIYYLWIGPAFVAAVRAAEGQSVLPRRFRR